MRLEALCRRMEAEATSPLLAELADSLPKAQAAVRTAEERYGALVAHMTEGVALHRLLYDDDGRPVGYEILDVNPRYETILGLSQERVIGRSAREIYGTPATPLPGHLPAGGRDGDRRPVHRRLRAPGQLLLRHRHPDRPRPVCHIFFDRSEHLRTKAALRGRDAPPSLPGWRICCA